MKRILFLLLFPFYIFSMQPDVEMAEMQSLRPASFMDAILQLNRSVPICLLMGKEIPATEFSKLPSELLVMIGTKCNLDDPKVIHAIDYIADTINGQLSLRKSENQNKLDKVLAFIDSCPLPLSTAIKEAFVKKYRWKYKKTLVHSSNIVWLGQRSYVSTAERVINVDNQQITALANGTIKVTDLRTNQEIFTTQLKFKNPFLQLHSDPTRLVIKDPTNGVTQLIWHLSGSFDTIINGQQCSGEKRKRRCIIKNGHFILPQETKKEKKDPGQNSKKKRK